MPKSPQSPASVLQSLMEEYQENPFSLSKKIGLSTSATRQIVIGESGITISTALRLAKFFGNCPSFWLDLQLQADMRAAENDKDLQSVLKGIPKAVKPAARVKGKPKTKLSKTSTLAGKRKEAAKVPGAKPVRGKRIPKAQTK